MGKINYALRQILSTLVSGYQYLLSPLMAPSCRFTPSCSQYTKEAIKQHGCIKGGYLSVARLLRCQPFSLPKWLVGKSIAQRWQSSGYDPVPTNSKLIK